MKKETTPKILECPDCDYRGIRISDNLTCKKCGGLMKIIAEGIIK